jgi:hypothetical protein
LACSAFLPSTLFAATPSTIVCVTCEDDSLAKQAEDEISEALINQGIRVADPSAIDEKYHEEGRGALAAAWGDGWGVAAMQWSSVSWVETIYHARRLFAAQLIVTDSELPYGEFTVHKVKTRLSYKCFDVVTHQMIAAGSYKAEARGEDASDATDNALGETVRNLASGSVYRLR